MTKPKHLERWTRPSHYAGPDWPEMFVFLGQNRDSACLDRSNFEIAQERLDAIPDPTLWPHAGPPWTVIRERHWLCGWVEWIGIHFDAVEHLKAADEMAGELEQYPVLDEDHFSEKEFNEAANYWEKADISERMELCKEKGVSVFAARRDCMPPTPSGELIVWIE